MPAHRRLARPMLGLLLAGVLLAPPVYADDACANPRAAALSLLDALQPEQYDPVAAARCLDLAPEDAARGPELAVRLKQVLDARGLDVP